MLSRIELSKLPVIIIISPFFIFILLINYNKKMYNEQYFQSKQSIK